MNQQLTQRVQYDLILADGSNWEIVSGDEESTSIVSQLGCAMRLRLTTGANKPSYHGNLYRLFVQVIADTSEVDYHIPLASKDKEVLVVNILKCLCGHWGGSYVNLVRLSLVFARQSQARGGVLIHGALAERDGIGVILTAPGGTGKTTASNRLPAPWRSICDDTTLVVRDLQGNYLAHPWPTWSRLLEEGPGVSSWNVQNAVPLKGIFFLTQAIEEKVVRLEPGHAVSLLMECVRQASSSMVFGLGKEELRALHLERFNNICTLVKVMPVHVLHISLTGTFWQEIEQALKEDR